MRTGSLADLTILRRISADDIRVQDVPRVGQHEPLQKLIDLASTTDATDFVVVDEQGGYKGMVVGLDIRTALLQPEAVSLLLVGELLRPGVPTVSGIETLDCVLDKFAECDVSSLPKCAPDDPTQILGLITRQAVMRRYHEELEQQTG